MKRQAAIAVFSIFALSLSACKSMHQQDNASDLDYAVSNDGTMLTAVKGRQAGICILRSSSTHPDPDDVTLVTEKGAISAEQLSGALSFMGYSEHIATILVGTILGAGAVAGGAYKVLKGIDADTAGIAEIAKSFKDVGKYGAISLTALVGGTFGYRIIKGNIQGERAKQIAVHSIFSLPPYGIIGAPVIEYIDRGGRLKQVMSEKEDLRITTKRMEKLISKLGKMTPEYRKGCSHIKAQLN